MLYIYTFLFFSLVNCLFFQGGIQKSEKVYYSNPPSESQLFIEKKDIPLYSNQKKKLLLLEFHSPREGEESIWQYMIIKNKKLWENIEIENGTFQLTTRDDNGFDLVIETGFHFSGSNYRMIQILRNTKGEAKARWDWSIEKNNSKPLSAFLFWDNQTNYLDDSTISESFIWKEIPAKWEIVKPIQDAFLGNILFYSNPSSEVVCNGIKMGKTPFSKKLKEGVYDCIFGVTGLSQKRYTFSVESGKEKKIFLQIENKTPFTSWTLEAIPGPIEIQANGKSMGLTPLNFPAQDKLNLALIQSTKSLSVNIYPELLDKKSLITFPYMIWDGFSPIFYSFWNVPQSPALSFEMNSYLSLVNESKEEINNWNYIESYYFLPEKYRIEGSFFPAEDTGQGLLLFQFGSIDDSISFEVEVDRVSLFHFPTGKKDIATYFYPLTDERKPRKFTLLTNPETETIEIYLNSKHVFTKKFSHNKPWKFLLGGKGKIFNRLNALMELKISCPSILTSDQIEIWERGSSRRNLNN